MSWFSAAVCGLGITVWAGASAPPNPSDGMLWFKADPQLAGMEGAMRYPLSLVNSDADALGHQCLILYTSNFNVSGSGLHVTLKNKYDGSTITIGISGAGFKRTNGSIFTAPLYVYRNGAWVQT